MTSRAVLAADRVVLGLLGLLLLAVGLFAAAWRLDLLDRVSVTAPDSLDAAALLEPTGTTWWPWAAGLGGVVVVLLALRWLTGHVPQQRVSTLRLPGSSATGLLESETGPVARAAADALASVPGVRSASGALRRERGSLVLVLTAEVDPASDLPQVVAGAERVTAEAAAVVGRDDVACRLRLRAGAGRSQLARVD